MRAAIKRAIKEQMATVLELGLICDKGELENLVDYYAEEFTQVQREHIELLEKICEEQEMDINAQADFQYFILATMSSLTLLCLYKAADIAKKQGYKGSLKKNIIEMVYSMIMQMEINDDEPTNK